MELSGFTKKVSDADIKKHIIEESIYGVDIDPGAVDIARLRFWLSLVVDEPKPQPLPNLSFKIVCANTLIPLGKPKGDLGGTNEIADEIEKIREEVFFVMFSNRKIPQIFNQMMAGILSQLDINEVAPENRNFFKDKSVLKRVAIPSWAKKAIFFRLFFKGWAMFFLKYIEKLIIFRAF